MFAAETTDAATFFSNLTEIFAFGSVWFWVLMLAFNAFIAFWINQSKAIYSSVAVLVMFVTFQFICGINIFEYIKDSPLYFLRDIAIYLVSGVLYAIGKWWLYSKEQRGRYEDYKQEFYSRSLQDEDSETRKLRFSEYIHQHMQPHELNPRIHQHKTRFVTWAAWWPWSLVVTLFKDLVVKIFDHIYYFLSGWLQSMSDRIWQSAQDDFYSETEFRIKKMASNQNPRQDPGWERRT